MQVLNSENEGQMHFIELPDDTDHPEADSLIEMAAHEICLELARRKKLSDLSDKPHESVARWLRPTCYRFIEHCGNHALLDHLFARIKRYGRYTDKQDLFSKGLLAIFAEDSANFSESDRSKFSAQLWYAYRHYVPAEFLNGFILTSQNVKSMKADSPIRQDMYDWIISRRSREFERSKLRVNYPDEIEKGVRECQIGMVEFFRENGRLSKVDSSSR